MKIAVFGTHAQRPDGRTMHFDILVRARFRHTEFAPPAVEAEIDRIGFAIIELQNCD